MSSKLILSSLMLCSFLIVIVEATTETCEPDGDIQFICGPTNPEDILQIPDSPWILVSSYENGGHIYAINSQEYISIPLFPNDKALLRHNTSTYSECPGPIMDGFMPHGLSLRPEKNGLNTLYVVRHGSRESVEIFELNLNTETPKITWTGCVIAPDTVRGNGVTALPEEGFALTSFSHTNAPNLTEDLIAGHPTGEVWEWHKKSGWKFVIGTEVSGPNGIEVSQDGRWLYLAAWGNRSLLRLPREQKTLSIKTINLGFHVDNIHWAPDGSLLAAGQAGKTDLVLACLFQQICNGVTTNIAKIDPDTLEAQEIIRYRSNDFIVAGTVAIQVGSEIWVGGVGNSNRIGRFKIN